MRKVTTILCSIAFMISGIMLAISTSNPFSSSGYKTIAAATPMFYTSTPLMAKDTGKMDIPESLLRDLAKEKGVLDTVYITKTDTVIKQVTKVKWRKAAAPEPIIEVDVIAEKRRDTIQVPVYYLATQVGNKEGPTGCISLYKLQKVEEICPDTTNSSVELVNERDVDVGE